MVTRSHESGFTLLEALVALSIVAIVVTTALMFRTGSLVDATEARNWRVAREVALELLSELKAGARQEPAEFQMQREPIPSMPDQKRWQYQIVIGEDRIAELEGQLESDAGGGGDGSGSDLRRFQQERDDLRAAKSNGMSYYEYQEQRMRELDDEETEDTPPSEDEFKEVAVFVFFPNPRVIVGEENQSSFFSLKARISTLALNCMTPDEAEAAEGSTAAAAAAGAGGEGTNGTGANR